MSASPSLPYPQFGDPSLVTRVTLFGGPNNNTYVFARALGTAGYDVTYVRDWGESYPLSQPPWEDVEGMVPYDELKPWPRAQWREWERAHGWKAPEWVTEPEGPSAAALTQERSLGAADNALLRSWLRSHPDLGAALSSMRDAEVVLVCGFRGALLALASGRPYIIRPHGGDMRAAAGLEALVSSGRGRRVRNSIGVRLLRTAFREAAAVTTDGRGWGCDVAKTAAVRSKLSRLPYPLEIRPRPSHPERQVALAQALESLGLPLPASSELVIFSPTRVDFHWKRQDEVIRGMARSSNQAPHLLLAGWGPDYRAALALADELGIGHRVSGLPGALTKPLVNRIYDSVDLTFDQLGWGAHGTSSLGALAGGCPVMMTLDARHYELSGLQPPPVLHASNAAGVAEVLDNIATAKVDLAQLAVESQAWISAKHGYPVFASAFGELLEGARHG